MNGEWGIAIVERALHDADRQVKEIGQSVRIRVPARRKGIVGRGTLA